MAIIETIVGHSYAMVLNSQYVRLFTQAELPTYDDAEFFLVDITAMLPVPQIGWFWNGTAFVDPSTIVISDTPSLTITGGKDDYSIVDSNPNATNYLLDIWDSLTNNRSSATLRTGNYKPNSKVYVWARYKNYLGSYSAWHRADANGQMVIIDPITSANTANSLVSSSPNSGSAASGAISVSAYNAFYQKGYVQWTASENEVVGFSIAISLEISNIVQSATPAADVFSVILRSYLFDVTTNVVVEGSYKYLIPFKSIGAKHYGGLLQNCTFNDTHVAGFRGSLTPGHQYRFAVDVGKFITSATTPTFLVDTNNANGFSGFVSFSQYS